MELTHIAARDGRLSSLLREDMQLSGGLVNRLKWQDRILVNGVSQHTDYPVKAGDQIVCLLEEPEIEYPAEDGELTVLYEDDAILAVEKPAGMLIHPSRSRNTGTLANIVQGYYAKTGQKCAFHPITRLDRDTFGVVLLAKNTHIHALLGQLHEQGKIDKRYEALVFGQLENDTGSIDAPIARLPLPSLLRKVDTKGKPSRTEYRMLENCGDYSRVLLRPVTGRTHQLRVHLSYVNHPILGDPQYGSPESMAFSARFGLQTQLLCARSLTFPHPVTGEVLTVASRQPVEI